MANLYINGEQVDGLGFMWDECHKFYLVRDDNDLRSIRANGWEAETLLPLEKLPQMWARQCGLGFINSADLSVEFIGQGEEAHTAAIEYR